MGSHLRILVNQVGYDSEKEKQFIVQSDQEEVAREFRIRDSEGKAVYAGRLDQAGTIDEWGYRYWVGDFTDLRAEGRFSVELCTRTRLMHSPTFLVAPGVIFTETAELAARFFYFQRCGFEVEDWHEPCHMDDARLPDGSHIDVTGGWHDAGDYNKYNGFTPLSVYALSYAYERRPDYFNRWATPRGSPTILDEALWGAKWLLKMQPEPGILLDRVFSGYSYWGPPEDETDNLPGTGDDRPVNGIASLWASAMAAAGLSKLSILIGNDTCAASAEALWEKAAEAKPSLESDAALLLADTSLNDAQGERRYTKDAKRRVESLIAAQQGDGWFSKEDGNPHNSITLLGMPCAALAEFALRSSEPDPDLVEAVSRYLDFSIRISGGPFMISKLYFADGSTVFFHPYPDEESWYVGQNSQYLSQAWAALLGFSLTGQKRFRRYGLAQINWILGANPFGICMFEGRGSANPRVYHHRYASIPGKERGAVPGCVPNGVVRVQPDRDAPRFDLRSSGRGDYHSNEPWLPHNAFYLLAASNL